MYMVLAPFTSDFWKSTIAKVALPLRLNRIPLSITSRKGNTRTNVAPKRPSIINRSQVRSTGGIRRRSSPSPSPSNSLTQPESSRVIESANAMSPTIPHFKRSQTAPANLTYYNDEEDNITVSNEDSVIIQVNLEDEDNDVKSENSFAINHLNNNSEGLPLRSGMSFPDYSKPVSLGNHFLSPDITLDLTLKLQRSNTSGISELSGFSTYSYSFDH